MIRSGFKHARPAHTIRLRDREPLPPRLTPVALVNASMAPVAGIPASAIEKENALQHAGYMDIVRAMPCAHCGRAPRSQFCHTDETKGMGIKTDCRKGWPGCDSCHFAIGTQRIYPKAERRALEARYAEQTRAAIVAAGLWPKTLPPWSMN